MILEIRKLTIDVEPDPPKRIVEAVDLKLQANEILALVGGSGSGKTTLGLAVMGLLAPALKVKSGEIIFAGEDLLKLPLEKMREVRGRSIGFIFQEPLQAFNPLFPIGYQIEEVLVFHTELSATQRQERVAELLALVEISEPRRVAASFPHQLSGGMRQRAMIAQAIAANPKLVIADEPTSSLDVTLQAKIMELFRRLRKELGLSILLITHDLGMVKHLADRVAVMNAGKIVESGSVAEIIQRPQHGYTKELMEATLL